MRVSERESVNTAWVEVQIGPNGISLSLISESPDSVGEVVENVEYLTFQELESRTGDSFELRLSDNTEELLSANGASPTAEAMVRQQLDDAGEPLDQEELIELLLANRAGSHGEKRSLL